MVFSGTSIKDRWTKPKWRKIQGGKWGWLGWEEVIGGNGDNCSGTTIKKSKKKKREIMQILYKMLEWLY